MTKKMSLKITYKKGVNEKNIKNFVLFSNEDFKINGLNKLSLAKKTIITMDIIKIKNASLSPLKKIKTSAAIKNRIDNISVS